MADFNVTNTVAEEFTYRAHPRNADGPVDGVTLIAAVVSGDGSVVADPDSPLDVRLLSGPSAGVTVFSIKGAGNVVLGLEDIVTMTQTAIAVPAATDLGSELIGPNPQS